jgi:hypothetical protein
MFMSYFFPVLNNIFSIFGVDLIIIFQLYFQAIDLDYYIFYFQDCQLLMAKFIRISKHNLQVYTKTEFIHFIRLVVIERPGRIDISILSQSFYESFSLNV